MHYHAALDVVTEKADKDADLLATRDARWNISLWNIKKFHENFEIFQDPFLKYFVKLLIVNRGLLSDLKLFKTKDD